MMTHAYDKTYLPDFMEELGAAFDSACALCGISAAEFGDRFISSGVANQIERGNPSYLAGLSGLEIAERVMERTGSTLPSAHFHYIHWPGPEYWTGWILAYLQWYTGWTFDFLSRHGYDAGSILGKYHPCHEASEDKFVEEAVDSIRTSLASSGSRLRQLRKAAGLTQKELSDCSGVKLRMIQAYEQRYQDISRAEAASVESLARVLGCPTAALL